MRNFKVVVNGNEYEVSVEETGATSAAVTPVAAPAPVAAAPQQKPAAPAPKAAVPAGGVQITAPMPGMILSFKVESGSVVKKGQPVMVLEAMKMENDIAATADGTITFVAAKGANVNSGDVLAVIKS